MTRIPTIQEIRDQILADIEAATGEAAPLLPRSTWRILATALAGALALVYRFGGWVRRQIFIATCDAAALAERGAELGLVPKSAVAWRGTARAAGVDGTTVPAGRLFRGNGRTYVAQNAVTVTGGSATVVLEATERGDGASLADGATIAVVTPLAGLEAEGMVLATEVVGEDAESTEAFRARVRLRRRLAPQGGAIPDWVLWATEVPGIAEAHVVRTEAGSLALFPITDDPDPALRIPNAAKIEEVRSYVTDLRRAPIRAAAVTVAAPTELIFRVEIAGLEPNTQEVRNAIDSAVEAHLYDRRPRQYLDEPGPRDVVSAAKITSIAIAAGAEVATVTLKNAGGVAIASHTVEVGQLARLEEEGVVWIQSPV